MVSVWERGKRVTVHGSGSHTTRWGHTALGLQGSNEGRQAWVTSTLPAAEPSH